MGIGTILGAAAKQISWEQLADLAMKYGPDLIRKLKEQLQGGSGEERGGATTEQLVDRIRELEQALVRQEEMIEQQARSIELLKQIGRTLQARLTIFMVLSGLSLAASAVLAVMLLNKP